MAVHLRTGKQRVGAVVKGQGACVCCEQEVVLSQHSAGGMAVHHVFLGTSSSGY